MLQKKYISTVVSVVSPFEGIYTVEFRPDKGRFKYLPGQFLHLALDADYDGTGQWPESRCFSMQSCPDEETIRITYAVKGDFTKQMERTLFPGVKVWLKLPYGDLFQQPHSKDCTVFIAGGTGVTPFLSLFSHHSFTQYVKPKIYLGFRTPEFNIYGEVLKELPSDYLTVYYQDVSGVIDINNIFKHNGVEVNYFISGPPAMIKSFKTELISRGVSKERILTDDWE